MDSYIKARLERAEQHLNQGLAYSKGLTSNVWTPAEMRINCIKAGLAEFKKIEKYIHQCGAQTKQDAQYHSIIE